MGLWGAVACGKELSERERLGHPLLSTPHPQYSGFRALTVPIKLHCAKNPAGELGAPGAWVPWSGCTAEGNIRNTVLPGHMRTIPNKLTRPSGRVLLIKLYLANTPCYSFFSPCKFTCR